MSESAFKSIIDLKKTLQEKIRNEGKTLLKIELDKFLDKHQEIHTLLWAQSDNVYNDEGYEFQVFGADFLPQTDLPWSAEFYRLLEDDFLGRHEKVEDKAHFNGETGWVLTNVAKKFPEYAEHLELIRKDFNDLFNSIPDEIHQVFGNVAVRVTREGIFMADFDYNY